MNANKITLVEDDETLLEIAKHHLKEAGYKVESYISGEEALDNLKNDRPDLILTDLILDGNMNGDELLFKIRETNQALPLILMTANGSVESAVACLRAGAWTYLTKPFHWDEMLVEIKKALRLNALEEENRKLKIMVGSYNDYDGIIGDSSAMVELKKQLPRIAGSDAPTLIRGESGTGKEKVARALHMNSDRKNGPFVAVNCGAIVKELAESELFGHSKGAFTGAHQDKKGYFREAQGGTLFLDEIGELPLNLQVKLLRVLQEKEVTPVGESKSTPIDVRFISATNVDLEEGIRSGDFREDLYYRISVLPIELPPLRERHGDIPVLIQYFLSQLDYHGVGMSEDFWEEIGLHTWPGNIRELENLVKRSSVMIPPDTRWTGGHAKEFISQRKAIACIPYEIPDEGLHLDSLMRKLVQSALHKTSGNQSKAAKMLGISRSALIYRMQKFEITD